MQGRGSPYILSLSMLLVGMFLCSTNVRAQDPQFSQFYAASLYLNPAFTGNTTQSKLSGIYRNQWPSIPGAFVSYAFSYDQSLPKVNGGIGFMVSHDKSGTAGLRYTNIGGLYSYAFKLNKTLMGRAGIKFSYTFRDFDQSQFVFADQIIRDGATSSLEANLQQGISYADIGSGLLIYSKNYWAGFSLDHLNRPNQSLIGERTELPVKFSVHGGYKFLLEGDLEDKITKSITVAAIYKSQLRWDQTDIGFYYTRNKLVLGLWYRGIPILKSYKPEYINHDAVILLLGMDVNGMRIGYTYDITVSKLIKDTGGSHEVSITYEWSQKKRKRRRRFVVPCAKF